MDLAESDENGNENERRNENEKGNGRQPYIMRMCMAYYRVILYAPSRSVNETILEPIPNSSAARARVPLHAAL